MRVTVNVPDRVVHDLKIHAAKERKSVSSLVTEFIENGIKDKKRRAAKQNILQMIGKVNVDKKALKMLDELRSEDDRT
jgi:plasmid stability protein